MMPRLKSVSTMVAAAAAACILPGVAGARATDSGANLRASGVYVVATNLSMQKDSAYVPVAKPRKMTLIVGEDEVSQPLVYHLTSLNWTSWGASSSTGRGRGRVGCEHCPESSTSVKVQLGHLVHMEQCGETLSKRAYSRAKVTLRVRGRSFNSSAIALSIAEGC